MATTKKRQAKNQQGPIQKKSKIIQSKEESVKKRSRPITAIQDDNDEEEDSEEEEGDDEFDLEEETNEMDVDQPTPNPKDPNGTSPPLTLVY